MKKINPFKQRPAGRWMLPVFLGLALQVNSQCLSDNYSSAAPWTAGAGANPPVVTSNQLQFNATQGAVMNYIYRSLGFTLNATDTWTAEVEFRPQSTGSNCPSSTILSVTAGTTNSWNSSIVGYPASNQDALEIYYLTSYCGAANTWQLFGRSKDGTTWNTASTGINIDPAANPGVTYYLRLERLSTTQGRISVFTNATFTTHATGSPQCFPITHSGANTVTGLTHVQHGCIPQGASQRTLTAVLDNLNICNNTLCDDYSSATPWAQTGTAVSVGSNVCTFNSCPDNADHRVDRALGNLVATSIHWRAQTEFTPTAISTFGPGHGILSISEGSAQNIWAFASGTPNQDVISAYLTSVANGGSTTWMLHGQAKNGTTWDAASPGINLPNLNVTYFIVLERIDDLNGRVAAYSDAAHLNLIGSECFDIPAGVTGLNTLNHGSMQQGWTSRNLTATIDNTCIFNQFIDGGTIGTDDTICSGTSPAMLTIIDLPSTYSCVGTPSFQWEQETSCGSGVWNPITGANSATYSPGTLTTTTCYHLATSGGLIPCGMTMFSNTVTITVLPSPVADAGPDTTICKTWLGGNPAYTYTLGGSPTASGGTSPYTYSWTPTANLSSAIVANPVWTPPVAIATYTFTVTVTDDNGCFDTDAVIITVNPACRMAAPQGTDPLVGELYPNPSDGHFTLSFAEGSPAQDIEITDVLGRVVYRKMNNEDQSVQFDLSAQPKGVYFVKVNSGGRSTIYEAVVQ